MRDFTPHGLESLDLVVESSVKGTKKKADFVGVWADTAFLFGSSEEGRRLLWLWLNNQLILLVLTVNRQLLFVFFHI